MKINYLATILIATFGIAPNVSEAKRRVLDEWLGVTREPWEDILWGVIVGTLLLAFIAAKLFRKFIDIQCPKCNEPNAMERTGRKKTTGFFERNLGEWKCMYCDHREWKKGPWIESDDHGGGP